MKHGYFKYLLLSLILLTSTLALHAGLIFYEDFDASTELPAGWTTAQTESAYSADIVWRIDDYASWYGGNFSNNCAAYDEPYNYYYSDPNLKAHLTTPAIDCTGHSNVTLVWDNYADVYAYLGVGADVLISNDGENWHRIKRYQDYHTAEQEIIDISEYAANKSTVYVRWSWDAYLYYWAIDNVQLLSFSDEPLPVVLNKPDDGAINLPLETNLTWTPSNLGNQPTGYKVYLDTVNPPEAMVYDGTDKTCSPTLAYDTEYFWRVIPYNEHGSTATEDCVVRSFRTYPAEPLPALLVGPADNEVDVHPYKTLIWEAQKEGFKPVGYKVYMDTNNPPETLVYEGSNTSFDPEFDFNTQYYWRVIPYSADAETKTEDCDIWSFKTTDLYSAPYSQPFNGFRPAGWKTEELTGRYPTNLFVFNNPGGREPDGNFDEDFATYDRKNTGGNSAAKPALITPPIDCSEASNVTIGYDQFHMNDFYAATYEVHVSTDGINWTLLRKATTPTNVAERYHFNISDIAVGQKTVYVRWHAYSSVHYYAIDNVDFIVYEGVPHAATLATPADGTDDLPLSTKLTWVAPVLGPEVDGYKVYIDTMDPPEAFFDVGNVLEYSPTLAYNTKYYWQVVPYNSSGDTDREDCETWTLKTYAAEPLPVVVVSPKNNAEHITVGSTIEWTANAKGIRPTGYKIRLDTVTPPGNEVDLGDLTTYTPGFAPNTTYYWRVIPYSADGEADLENTTIYNFTTSQPNPYAANVEAPRNGATYVPVSQKLQWSHSAIGEQATGYKVYLDTTNPPTTEVYNGSDTEYAADLDFDTEYFWQVVPYNGAGDATDCPVWSFTTSPVFNLPFTENFDASTSTPVGWTNDQLAADKGSTYVWRFDNPYGQYIYGDISGNFPIFDNEYYGYIEGLKGALTTPAIDCSEVTKVNLSYDYYSDIYSGNVDVLVSTDRENWTRVRRYNDWEYGNENLDISEHAAGNKTVYVRWQWDAYYYFFAFDNVLIFGPMKPNPVTLSAPANNAINLATNTQLKWIAATTGSAADGYYLYLGTDPELNVDPIDVGNVTTYSPELQEATVYYWRVVPYNEVGTTPFEDCEVRSFTTVYPYPLPVTIVSPLNETFHLDHESVELKWQKNNVGVAATGFKVYLDENNPPVTLIYEGEELTYTVENLDLATTYYWRVVPFAGEEVTPAEMCAVSQFTTTQPPLAAGTYLVTLDYPEEGDFRTVRHAAEAAANRGIEGPVVFEIAPGTYNEEGKINLEPIHITNIPGASAENTVTFISKEETNPAKVYVSTVSGGMWPPPDLLPRCSIALDGASYVRFENLIFTRTHTGGATTAHFGIRNESHDIEIVNCHFNHTDGDLLAVDSVESHNILFEGNTYKKGRGVSFKGKNDNFATGIVIRNNKFTVENSAITLDFADSFVISNNILENNYDGTSVSDKRVIYLGSTKGSILIDSNKMFGYTHYAIVWGWPGGMFDVTGGHVSDGKPAYIVNNIFGGGQKVTGTTASCIYAQGAIHDVYFYYNSFNLTSVGVNQGGSPLVIAQASTGLRFLNNSFAYTGGDKYATCFSIPLPETMIDACDYNNYYSNGTAPFINYGGQRSTLAEVQAVDGRNQNSRVGDPEYISSTDLHTYGTQLWKAGVPIDAFTKDIDGDERDGSNPCIGADEYQAIIDRDLAAIAIDGPEIATAGEVAEFEITVVNNGRIWQSNYIVKLMKDDGTELASIEVADAIFEDQEVIHTIEWIPTEEDMFDVYGLVVLEGDQLTYNDATEMHSIFVMPLTHLNAPVATLTVDEEQDYGTLTWTSVPGAKSYIVYGAFTIDGPWQQLKVTDKLHVSSPLVSAYGRMAFFKVVASSEPKTMLLETPRIQRDAEIQKNKR